LSQIDLTIEKCPEKDNIVADAMSRFVYSATSPKQDISWHGCFSAKNVAEKQFSSEFAEGRQLRPLTFWFAFQFDTLGEG